MNLGTESDGMIPRLYVDAPLAAGAAIALDGPRGHYLRNVLRREKGASVLLFNGRDGEWLAEIEALAKSGARLSVQRQTVAQRMHHEFGCVMHAQCLHQVAAVHGQGTHVPPYYRYPPGNA